MIRRVHPHAPAPFLLKPVGFIGIVFDGLDRLLRHLTRCRIKIDLAEYLARGLDIFRRSVSLKLARAFGAPNVVAFSMRRAHRFETSCSSTAILSSSGMVISSCFLQKALRQRWAICLPGSASGKTGPRTATRFPRPGPPCSCDGTTTPSRYTM